MTGLMIGLSRGMHVCAADAPAAILSTTGSEYGATSCGNGVCGGTNRWRRTTYGAIDWSCDM